MERGIISKLAGMSLCVTVMFLFCVTQVSYAVDKDEFTKEYKEAYQGLMKDNPEAARAFREEVTTAISRGEIQISARSDVHLDYNAKDKINTQTEAGYEGSKEGIPLKDMHLTGDEPPVKVYVGNEPPKIEADKLGITQEQGQALEGLMKDAMEGKASWTEVDAKFKELGVAEKFEGGPNYEHGDFNHGDYERTMTPERALETFNREVEAGHMDMFDKETQKAMKDAMERGDMQAAEKIGREMAETQHREGGDVRQREIDVREMDVEHARQEYEKNTGREFTRDMEREFERWKEDRERQDRQDFRDFPQPEPPQPQPNS